MIKNPKLTLKNTYIILPTYNEEQVISEVLSELFKTAAFCIIVVDDGSTDKTYEKLLKEKGIILTRHLINRGKGAAVKTGIAIASALDAEAVITMDSDGQHDPNDLLKMVETANNGYDVVLGSRFLNPKLKMPLIKRTYNYIGNLLTWVVFGVLVSDSQSGLRIFSKKAIKTINTKGDRYEYESEVLNELKKHSLKYTEIPINVRYTTYSQTKNNKQGLINGIKTLFKMILND